MIENDKIELIEGERMKEKTRIVKVESVIPYYLIGISWCMMAFILNMTHLSSYLIATGVSIIVFIGAKKWIPAKEVTIREPISTQDAQADEFLRQGEQFIQQLEALHQCIDQSEVKAAVLRLIQATNRLLDYVMEHPVQAKRLKKYMTYYLPTLTKMLHSYESLEENTNKGENMTTTMLEIEGVMGNVADAFEKQLDVLYAEEKMDIVSDIQVMETLMCQQGLTKENENGR